jgi:rubredoxin
MTKPKLACSICGDEYPERRGNNADPINKGECCDICNWLFVIPARGIQEAEYLSRRKAAAH